MSKSLSILVFLKKQKSDARGTAPLYVRITIDGDTDEFSLSCRILVTDWSQAKQKCTAKSQEAIQLNAKIAKTRGDLTSLFDRIPTCELVKAKQLIKLYQGKDSQSDQQLKKDVLYHKRVLTIIDQYMVLKNEEKKRCKKMSQSRHPVPITEQFGGLILEIEEFLRQSRSWMDDPAVEKTLMDAQYTFLLKFLYRVLKGTASHETFRKWVSTKNTFKTFLHYRYKSDDYPLTGLPLKFAVDLHEYLTLTNSIGNNAAMKYIKNLKQVIDDVVVQG
jgi:Arm DNA-binding domain/Phage integrase SAM-like domain